MGRGRDVTAIFLQVRLDSSRLPQKALLPLSGVSVIEHAMSALRLVPADVHALLTDEESAPVLEKYAEKGGFRVFPGPKEDVLRRYSLAAEHFGVSILVRATGDNPLVSPALTERIVSLHRASGADYSGFLGMPLGTGVEVIDAETLLLADKEAEDPYEREHVSPFLYRRPDRFVINRLYAEERYLLQDARVTLDTPEDYEFLCRIYEELYRGKPIETDDLVRWLKRHQTARIGEKVGG